MCFCQDSGWSPWWSDSQHPAEQKHHALRSRLHSWESSNCWQTAFSFLSFFLSIYPWSIFGTGHIKTSLVSWGMDHQCWCRRWAPAGWSYMSLSLSSSASILDYLTFAKSKGYYTWLLWQSDLKWWCFGWFWDRIKSWPLRRPNPAGTHRSRDACRLRGSGITFIDP